MSEGICVLRCKNYQNHGYVVCNEIYDDGPVKFTIKIFGIDPGYHGIHIHRKGNDLEGPSCLCDHYNPTNEVHGGLNVTPSHSGDLGNIQCKPYYDETINDMIGVCYTEIVSYKLTMKELYGRSIVVHEQRDDLGLGSNEESLKTGNSGERILWGIIGRN